jgi:3D (Asp-Asp-Asp) domain-containing protein
MTTTRDRTVALLALLVLAGCMSRPRPGIETAPPPPAPPPAAPAKVQPTYIDFEATAYAIDGLTAAGTRARKGVVAADPAVLPLGSRIRVLDAGAYSGEYVVEDTGRTIDGHEIDIYLASDAEARRFGRRQVRVEVLRRGKDGARPSSPTSGRR